MDAIKMIPKSVEMKLRDALDQIKDHFPASTSLFSLLDMPASFGAIKTTFLLRSNQSSAEIAAVMPSRNFDETKDFINGQIYAEKRLFFMVRLAVALQRQLNGKQKILFGFTPLRIPIVVVEEDGHYKITIRPTLRSKISGQEGIDVAVARDAQLAVMQRKWDEAVSANPGIDGLLDVLEIWAGRLSLGSLGRDFLSDLVAHLVLTEKLSSLMGECQMLVAVFRFLSECRVETLVPGISLHLSSSDASVLIELARRIRRNLDTFPNGSLHCLAAAMPIRQQCDLVFRLKTTASVQDIRRVLERGLTDRIRHLLIWPQISKPWPIGELPSDLHTDEFIVGLIIDGQHAFRLADFGPLREQTAECAEYRHFWGASKCELRRLSDGRIHEAVVWEEFSSRRRDICFAICAHLTKLHFGKDALLEKMSGAHRIGNEIDVPASIPIAEYGSALSDFTKHLRSLKHLPLAISRCEVWGPHATPLTVPAGLWDHRTDILVGLESSSQWPSDLNAANLSRTAMAIHLSRVLAKQAAGVVVGTRLTNDGRLDVEYRGEGGKSFWFYCHIFCESELKAGFSFASKALLQSEYAHAVKHVAMRFYAFGPTCRLVKEWISSQKLIRFLDPFFIDLMVAQLFVGTGSSASAGNLIPQSAWIGFLQFLTLLTTRDWKTVPIVLALNSKAPTDDQDKEEEAVLIKMASAPATAPEGFSTCIFTPVEGFQVPSTFSLPETASASLVELCGQARAALHAINQTECPIAVLFRRSERSFDAVYDIGDVMGRFRKNAAHLNDPRMAGFDPVKALLADLENQYGRHVNFYYDPLREPTKIAIRRTAEHDVDVLTEIHKFMDQFK